MKQPEPLLVHEIETIKGILDRQASRRIKRKQNIAQGRMRAERVRPITTYSDTEALLQILHRTHDIPWMSKQIGEL